MMNKNIKIPNSVSKYYDRFASPWKYIPPKFRKKALSRWLKKYEKMSIVEILTQGLNKNK